MDFFRAQDDARRKTWQLVGLFVLAVAALVVVTNLLVGVTLAWFGQHTMVTSLDPLVRTIPSSYWPLVTIAVVGVIAAASGYKYLALRSGGRAVAALVGGRKIDPSTTVVAEVSITIATPAWRSRRCRASVRPSSPGMWMSMSARSTGSFATSFRAAAALSAPTAA